MTLTEAKALEYGQIIYHITDKNADGTPTRWRVSGNVKTWKRSPERVKVPIKHGLYSHGYIDETNLQYLRLTDFDEICVPGLHTKR